MSSIAKISLLGIKWLEYGWNMWRGWAKGPDQNRLEVAKMHRFIVLAALALCTMGCTVGASAGASASAGGGFYATTGVPVHRRVLVEEVPTRTRYVDDRSRARSVDRSTNVTQVTNVTNVTNTNVTNVDRSKHVTVQVNNKSNAPVPAPERSRQVRSVRSDVDHRRRHLGAGSSLGNLRSGPGDARKRFCRDRFL